MKKNSLNECVLSSSFCLWVSIATGIYHVHTILDDCVYIAIKCTVCSPLCGLEFPIQCGCECCKWLVKRLDKVITQEFEINTRYLARKLNFKFMQIKMNERTEFLDVCDFFCVLIYTKLLMIFSFLQ